MIHWRNATCCNQVSAEIVTIRIEGRGVGLRSACLGGVDALGIGEVVLGDAIVGAHSGYCHKGEQGSEPGHAVESRHCCNALVLECVSSTGVVDGLYTVTVGLGLNADALITYATIYKGIRTLPNIRPETEHLPQWDRSTSPIVLVVRREG